MLGCMVAIAIVYMVPHYDEGLFQGFDTLIICLSIERGIFPIRCIRVSYLIGY